MTIDYSQYSLDELREAAETLDVEQFPGNSEALNREFARRAAAGDLDTHPSASAGPDPATLARRARRARWTIIVLFALGAVMFLWMAVELVSDPGPLPIVARWLFAATVAVAFGWTLAAYGLYRNRAWAFWLACAMLVLQVPKIESSVISYRHAIVAVYIQVSAAEEYGNTTAGVGLDVRIGPSLRFYLYPGDSYVFGFNVLAAILIVYLLRGRRTARQLKLQDTRTIQ